MKNVQYLIVGQGLAGTVLAHTLLKHTNSVVVIDAPGLSQASKIAAGLYNPIVFKRLAKSWRVNELLPAMDSFYPETEKILNEKFYFKKNIVKLFTEEQEKILWLKKSKEDAGKYLNDTIEQDFLSDIIYNTNGAAEVKQSGNLNMALFLSASQNYFTQKNILVEEEFDYSQLVVSENCVEYKTITAGKIIFCEGYKAIENPYFKELPFKLTKGEVITIRCPLLKQSDRVINKGVFILPVGNDIYKVGATYEWNDLTDKPTEKGKLELLEKLKKVLKVDFEILNHEAGIRPTTIQRRPLLGLHPEHKVLAVFNGLGTKGVMFAPFFATQLVQFLENATPLDAEVNIQTIL